MLGRRLPHAPSEEMTTDIDLLYEINPCELRLDGMIKVESESEMIGGLPVSDALTPTDCYLELFEHVQLSKLLVDSKTLPDCAPEMDPLDILTHHRRARCHRDSDLRRFAENRLWLPEAPSSEYVSGPGSLLEERIDQL